jgi:hypothetical protein
VHFLSTAVPAYARKSAHIYPNPVNHELHLSLEDVQRVEIYDQLGKMILSETNPHLTISVSSLPQGIYIVKISTENECYTEKFIKQ